MNKKLDDFLQLSEDAGSLQIKGFYREKEFKETEIGKVPKDWDVVKLGKVVEIWDKYRVPVKEQDRKPGPFPYCGANGIIDYVDGYTHEGEFVLLAEDGGFFGPFESSAYIMRGKFWANNHVHILKAIEGVLTNEFLMYYLNFTNLVPFLTGSTRPKLTQEDMKRIPIVFPPLQEQQKIAEILSTIDSAIQKINEGIEKAERIKKALMKELLSGKVRVKEENGSLTFWREKEFKDTEIGKIPKDWDVERVGDIFSLEYGKGLPERERVIGIYPVVGSNGIVGYHNRGIVKGPGIVIGRKGSIGAVTWVDQDFWPIDTTYYIKLKKHNISLKWLFFELIYLNLAKFHLADVVPGLKRELVYQLKIPLPTLQEQQKIAEILSQWDKIIELKKAKKEKLERMKKKVMELLLTGKVRVRLQHKTA